ncbi:AAA family ATPase [Pseudomonas sp. yb_2]|uniref:AAA family ATPase n=1 Tax=Pseudomonas sp. yb_2 TaxID=3367218 RepID=UPI00370A093B
MTRKSYLLESAYFDFGSGSRNCVRFIGESANVKKTHITFLVGANGTGKSRMLASVVDAFNDLHERYSTVGKRHRYISSNAHNLPCSDIVARHGGDVSETTFETAQGELFSYPAFPSKVLAISNLVIDKFPFRRDTTNEDQFYHYLGVRQATNLTTTGSADRAVAEAVIRMLSDDKRLKAFNSWVDIVFGGEREIGFGFTLFKLREIQKFLKSDDRLEYVKVRLGRRLGAQRMESTTDEEIVLLARNIEELFVLLAKYTKGEAEDKRKIGWVVRLASISKEDRQNISRLIVGFLAASRIGISVWPSLLFESSTWLNFEGLSSGQQNLLSVGAKVIAFSAPGCLVVIDEPEVSLNVVWQQRYIELLQKTLVGAPGSHVIIATHSPHMLSSASLGTSSIVTIGKSNGEMTFDVQDGVFEGWGSESILYNVLQIPSASNYHLTRELGAVLRHIQEGGRDKEFLTSFMHKVSRIDYAGVEPLELIVQEVRAYLERLA